MFAHKRRTGLFFLIATLCLAVSFQAPAYAFRAAPQDGETTPEAHQRTLDDFFSELKFYDLDPSGPEKVLSRLGALTEEVIALDGQAWPSRFALVLLSVDWYEGPRDSYLESDEMRTIYDDLLHKDYWLKSPNVVAGEKDPVKDLVAELSRRAKEANLLSALEDMDGNMVQVTVTDRAYDAYGLAEAANFQAGYLKAVLDLGKDIMDINSAPGSLQTDKIPEIGDEIVYFDDDKTLEDYLSEEGEETPALFIFEKQSLRPEKALLLKAQEKEMLLTHFLPLNFPRSTGDLLERLNKNEKLREHFKKVRETYLKEHAEEMKKYAIDDSIFLDEEELAQEEALPLEIVLVAKETPESEGVLPEGTAIFSADDLSDSVVEYEEGEDPVVLIVFNEKAKQRLKGLAAMNAGDRLYFVADGQTLATYTIVPEAANGILRVENDFSDEEANEINDAIWMSVFGTTSEN